MPIGLEAPALRGDGLGVRGGAGGGAGRSRPGPARRRRRRRCRHGGWPSLPSGMVWLCLWRLRWRWLGVPMLAAGPGESAAAPAAGPVRLGRCAADRCRGGRGDVAAAAVRGFGLDARHLAACPWAGGGTALAGGLATRRWRDLTAARACRLRAVPEGRWPCCCAAARRRRPAARVRWWSRPSPCVVVAAAAR